MKCIIKNSNYSTDACITFLQHIERAQTSPVKWKKKDRVRSGSGTSTSKVRALASYSNSRVTSTNLKRPEGWIIQWPYWTSSLQSDPVLCNSALSQYRSCWDRFIFDGTKKASSCFFIIPINRASYSESCHHTKKWHITGRGVTLSITDTMLTITSGADLAVGGGWPDLSSMSSIGSNGSILGWARVMAGGGLSSMTLALRTMVGWQPGLPLLLPRLLFLYNTGLSILLACTHSEELTKGQFLAKFCGMDIGCSL